MSIESVMPSSSPSVAPFCPQSFPASGSFPVSQLFTSGDLSIGASASASVLPMSIQGWLPFRLTDWISLQSKGLSKVFSNTTVQKHQFFGCSAFFMVLVSHQYMTTRKTIALTIWTFVRKVISLLFNILSRFAIAFLPGSDFMAAVTIRSDVRAQEQEICQCLHLVPFYVPWSHGLDAMTLVFWMLSFEPAF